MKIKNLLLFAAAASLGLSAFAQEVTNGEYVEFKAGTPTQDHFFVRGTYDDMGTPETYDNKVSFKGGTPQLVWIHLNDDEIYLNEDIQNLAPSEYKAGSVYNEITYNSFQFDIYMPQSIEIIIPIDEETGEETPFVQGDRLPGSSKISWAKKDGSVKVIDGVNYDVYTFTCFNDAKYATHFSAKNATLYERNGALKKDATLFGIYLQNKNQDQVEGRINGDMILGNTLLTLRETPEIFFYGTGGRDVENRYMQFNRVEMYGSAAVVENLAQKTVNNVKYFNVAGMESNVPFEGVNIMVTTYNDGTTSTCKVIK
ncbi:MAG: hypothetical protein IKN10_04930 [Muribaculaceae bacterium]|nr:hypothetical protein [Muribaculaceae bacterium]